MVWGKLAHAHYYRGRFAREGSSEREQQFERLGVFTYSYEPDTPAARLPDHLPEDIKSQRRDRLMEAQQDVAFDWNAAQVGRQLDVLIDTGHPDQDNVWIGRTYADAPDIDGLVFVTASELAVGDLVRCEIVAHEGYDLVAVPAGSGDAVS